MSNLIYKPVAINNERFPFLEACQKVLHKTRFQRPVRGVVVIVAYEDGTISSGALGLDIAEARLALDGARDGLSGST